MIQDWNTGTMNDAFDKTGVGYTFHKDFSLSF